MEIRRLTEDDWERLRDVRRQRVGAALVHAVVSWARERGAPEVHLWVADGNEAALGLYRHLGFEPTGIRQPLPSNPSVSEEMLRLALSEA